jgi:hypothetical protein
MSGGNRYLCLCNSGVCKMCLITEDIHKAIMAARLYYYKVIMAVPSVSLDTGKQAPAGLVQGQETFRNDNGCILLKKSDIKETNGWAKIMAALGTTPINLGLLLSQSLLEVEPRFRPMEIQDIFAGIIRNAEGGLVAMDHLEIFFQRGLQLDPLRMLLQHSRNKVLIVRWPGVFSGDKLIYGEPHHPEYRCYEQVDAVVCCMNPCG